MTNPAGLREQADVRLHLIHGKDPASSVGAAGSYPLLCHLLDTAVVARHLWSTRVRPRLRTRIAEIIGVDEDSARELLALTAAVHDLGKANPFFQYQERRGAESGFAADLARALDLPPTPPALRDQLNGDFVHPLRRHEFITHRIVTGEWAMSSHPIGGARWIGTIAGGHHGHWRAPAPAGGTWVGEPDGAGEALIADWAPEQATLLEMVEAALGRTVESAPPLSSPRAGVVLVAFSGLLTLADWIASDDTRVSEGKVMWESAQASDRDPHSSVDAARAWMDARTPGLTAHVDGSLGPQRRASREALSAAALGEYDPRPLQREARDLVPDSDPGLWIAMYPTGDGKTEAALLRGAVDPSEGLFFGLPTMATTDAMEKRLQQFGDALGDAGFGLLKSHQMASLMDPRDEAVTRDQSEDHVCDHADRTWYSTSIRKLLAPNVVATVDQALTGALAAKHVTLRLFGLANHHVVLDEVHTYDAYQSDLLVELLYWWGSTGTRVTLLSATLPEAQMKDMVRAYRSGVLGTAPDDSTAEIDSLAPGFPSTVSVASTERDGGVVVSSARPLGEVRRPPATALEVVEVRTSSARVAEHVGWVRRVVAQYPRSPVAVVSNVVSDCAAIAAALAADPSVARSHDVICLHSGFVAGHRVANEACLAQRLGPTAHRSGLAQGRPLVVVGTQVIQASLDFDVDFMATDLAPAPDLIQRLGRVWRFDGMPGTPFRGGRLPAGKARSLRIVAVTDRPGVPSRRGAPPYLQAVLKRTLDAGRAKAGHGSPVDVMAFSQAWVDAAYEPDAFALLSQDEATQASAVEERLAGSRRQSAAAVSRAQLGRPSELAGRPLLMRPRRKGPQWRDLVALTARPDDEDLMRTRYIERDSVNALLFDSQRESFYSDPITLATHRFPNLDIQELAKESSRFVAQMGTRFLVSVPAALADQAEVAIAATIGGGEWNPRSNLLRFARPLDLRHLRGVATYHPLTGLTKDA